MMRRSAVVLTSGCKMSDLTAEFIRSILTYDPDTGVFRWKENACSKRVGCVAGRINKRGYGQISIRGKLRSSHKLAWLYVYGEWLPSHVYMDHINGKPADNRIANLRVVTPQQNAQNRGRKKPGLKGAHFNKICRKWQSTIRTPDGKYRYLGVFKTPEEAHEAYMDAARRMHGEFVRVF